MTAEYKIGLSPVANEQAQGTAREILESTQAQLGFVPNLYFGKPGREERCGFSVGDHAA